MKWRRVKFAISRPFLLYEDDFKWIHLLLFCFSSVALKCNQPTWNDVYVHISDLVCNRTYRKATKCVPFSSSFLPHLKSKPIYYRVNLQFFDHFYWWNSNGALFSFVIDWFDCTIHIHIQLWKIHFKNRVNQISILFTLSITWISHQNHFTSDQSRHYNT